MFLTAEQFNTHYGVDLDIARFFVDRKVPEENTYWKNRTIYIPSAPGYIFIPLYFDLVMRCGAEKTELLQEKTSGVSEFILHSAARLEFKQINWKQHVDEVKRHLEFRIQRRELWNSLVQYLFQDKPLRMDELKLGSSFPSLNRADSYLFLLATLESKYLNEQLAIDAWSALMTYFLLMDDLSDIKEDLQNSEDNAFVEAGLNSNGIQEIKMMLDTSITTLDAVNPILAGRLKNQKNLIDIDAMIQSIRSSS